MAKQVSALLRDFLPQQHQWKMKLMQEWDGIIGTLGDKVRIEKIDGDLLVLGVIHPSWAQELMFLSAMLRNKINDALGSQRIKTIRCKTIVRRGTPARRDPAGLRKTMAPRAYDEAKRSPKQERSLKKIKDTEMRQVFAAYLNRVQAMTKSAQ